MKFIHDIKCYTWRKVDKFGRLWYNLNNCFKKAKYIKGSILPERFDYL